MRMGGGKVKGDSLNIIRHNLPMPDNLNSVNIRGKRGRGGNVTVDNNDEGILAQFSTKTTSVRRKCRLRNCAATGQAGGREIDVVGHCLIVRDSGGLPVELSNPIRGVTNLKQVGKRLTNRERRSECTVENGREG
jgi:hypothetical protein